MLGIVRGILIGVVVLSDVVVCGELIVGVLNCTAEPPGRCVTDR